MKKVAALIALWFAVAACAFAQRGFAHGGVGRGGGFGFGHGGFGLGHGGFGRIGFGRPGFGGFGHGGFIGGGLVSGSRFGFGFGNIVFPGGFRRFSGVRPFFGRGFSADFGSYLPFLPYSFPAFYDGVGYPEYPYPSSQYPYPGSQPIIVVVYPQSPGSPEVVLNEAPATPRPRVREYGEKQQKNPDPPGENGPLVFSIAMKDHTVTAAIAYWVIGDRLNYIDQQGVHFEIPLDRVDRARSLQINHSRGIDFGLPQG